MLSPKIRFSILICTYDRSQYLWDLFSSLQIQDFPHDAFEVIVINNASTNKTEAIVNKFQNTETLSVSYFQLSSPGLSKARNFGAKQANGGVLVYLDDDTIASPRLLSQFALAFEQCTQTTVCIGGGVWLKWPDEQVPAWLPAEFLSYFGSTYEIGRLARYLEKNEFPVGADMAIRRSALLELGGFSESLGRKGNILLSNEEIGFCQRATSAGYQIYYEPAASVQHRVARERTSKIWLLKRLYWQGISDAVMISHRQRRSRFVVIYRIVVNAKNSLQKVSRGLIFFLRRRNHSAMSDFANGAAYFGRVHQDVRLLFGVT